MLCKQAQPPAPPILNLEARRQSCATKDVCMFRDDGLRFRLLEQLQY